MKFYGTSITSHLLLGTAQYPSPAILSEAVKASATEIVTVSLRREAADHLAGQAFWSLIRELDVHVLPNTAGCFSVKEAMTTAQMAREVFNTKWIKLEVIRDEDTLAPNLPLLLEAAKLLIAEDFQVFPYTTEDLSVAEKLLELGCGVLMPWGAPIGSARGLNNIYGLKMLRAHFPDTPILIDAGIGVPSHATQAMEMGFDGVLLNTAVAKAGNPVLMARAFAIAIAAGRLAYQSGPLAPRDMAMPSTPMLGRAKLSGT
jgi:thiazole synthase